MATKKSQKIVKTTNVTQIEEIAGWIGMLLILVSYGLNNLLIISVTDITYILMNIFGSVAVFWISWRKRTYQPATLNIIWALIGLIALVRVFL